MTVKAWEIYDLLIDHAQCDDPVDQLMIGLTWTLAQIGSPTRIGLSMSPVQHSRLLTWPGTLSGRSVREISSWVKHWDPHEAVTGMAVINALINGQYNVNNRAENSISDTPVATSGVPANLGVFEYFLPEITGKKVAVIGRYPDLERYEQQVKMTVLERTPQGSDLPDPACEYVLPASDWVFITASSIPNKTFPRLLELSKDATVVLMGPGTPWLDDLKQLGVNYLAGVVVTDETRLKQTVMEGGGRRIFETGVRYQIRQISNK